jgi:DtxR family transcriptional regulator, Mn-dependent transcriptional regulator
MFSKMPGHSSDRTSPVLTDTALEYLETVYNITVEGDAVVNVRLAEKFGVSPPSVTEMMHRLEKGGFLTSERATGLRLTPSGMAAAERSLRHHRLAERFLQDILGMDWIVAHEEAHALQKAMTPAIEAQMVRLLRNPTTCPHGNPIPGSAPSAHDYLRSHGAVRLSRAPHHSPLRVLCVSEVVEDETALLRLVGELGLRPGANLVVEEPRADSPNRVAMAMGTRKRELDRAVAEKIWVYAPGADVGADGGI